MTAQISFDLVMHDEMPFVEGTYLLPGREWQVLIFSSYADLEKPVVLTDARWESGVTGVHIKWPACTRLNKYAVLQLLSEQLGVTHWQEVRGPDSMALR